MSISHSSPAFERQLKKIYDCLNIGSNKKAVQEVDRLPKNVKDQTVFKALKALALIRMGKRRLAFDILDEIDPNDDLDEVTLQTMTSCYKESVDVARIVTLYEAAADHKPNDPDIMARLFMAYVRVFNFKRQKEIALQLYKKFAKDKRLYSFWAIMSLIMQSQVKGDDGKDTTDKEVCLTLAEKMCEKMIDEERTHEEIELYLTILRRQNKHEKEYRILTGHICLRLPDHLSWFNRRRAYLCLDLKMYSRAFKHYFPTLIQEYPDQIEYYQGLFKSALLLDTEAQSQQQPIATNDQQPIATNQVTPVKSTSALAECYDIVERQCQFALESQETVNSKGKGHAVSKNVSRTSSQNPNRRRLLRGPFMARIELYHTIITNEKNLPISIFNQCKNQFLNRHADYNSLLLDFFQSFAKKIICYYDMDYMLNTFKFPKNVTDKLLEDISAWIEGLKKNSSDISEYDLFHVILNHDMLRHSLHEYSTNDTREGRIQLSKSYITKYDNYRHLAKQTTKTEFLPVDHYCLLAINAIMTNSVDLSDLVSPRILSDKIMITVLVLAENAVLNSPSNHQIKLLLLKLYSFLGASKQSADALLYIYIKHIQIDTLGHLLNPVLYNTGNYTLSKESLETCLESYAHGMRDCFEGLVASYKDGNFSRIEEISLVLKRISDSLNSAQCVLLKSIVSNLNAASIEELSQASQSFDQFKSLYRIFHCQNNNDSLMDNRDFRVLKSLHSETNQLLQDRKLQTLEDEKILLRLRYFLIRTLYIQLEYFIDTSGKRNKDDKLSDQKEIEYGQREVENLIHQVKNRLDQPMSNQYSFLEPEASPHRWTHIDFEKLVQLVLPLVFCTDPSTLTQDICDSYNSRMEDIIQDLETKISSISRLVMIKQVLMSLTLSIEFIALCCTSLVSISQCEQNLNGKPLSMNSATKSESSQSSLQQNHKSKTVVCQMINKTVAQLTKLSNLLKSIDLRSILMEKISSLEVSLLSDIEHSTVETVHGSKLFPLLSPDSSQVMFQKIKDKLLDSYNESFKEFETTCRRKIKLLRNKTA